MERTTPRKRLGISITVALGAVVAFAAIGGTGLAGSLVKPSKAQYAPGQYVNPGKVTICHKQKVTIRVSIRAWPAHQAHGDVLGSCAQAAAKAKAAKAAAAAKAAKAAAKANAKAAKAAANANAKAAKATAKAAKANATNVTTQSGQSPTPKGNGQGKAKGKSKG